MKELQKKQQFKRRLYSTPALVALLLVTILLARGAFAVLEKRQESVHYVEQLEDKVESLKKRQGELADEIETLKTPEGINAEIKEKFSVAEEGERVAIIVENPSSMKETELPKESLLKRFWNTLSSLWQ